MRVGNGAWNQVQLDVYGELLSTLHLYRERLGDLHPEIQAFVADLAGTAARRWREPDSGIWEMRGEPRHHLSSKVMCWVALDRAVELAPRLGMHAMAPEWAAARDELRAAILDRGWSEERQAYAQSFGSDELDAAQLLMPIYGFLPATDERMRSTIEAIARDLTEDGLVLRYRADEGLNADGLTGEEGTFVICSFWLVSCLARAGEMERAEELYARLAGYANDLGLLGEEIDTATGEQLGNFPQAYSHIGLITAAAALDGAGPEPSVSRRCPPRPRPRCTRCSAAPRPGRRGTRTSGGRSRGCRAPAPGAGARRRGRTRSPSGRRGCRDSVTPIRYMHSSKSSNSSTGSCRSSTSSISESRSCWSSSMRSAVDGAVLGAGGRRRDSERQRACERGEKDGAQVSQRPHPARSGRPSRVGRRRRRRGTCSPGRPSRCGRSTARGGTRTPWSRARRSGSRSAPSGSPYSVTGTHDTHDSQASKRSEAASSRRAARFSRRARRSSARSDRPGRAAREGRRTDAASAVPPGCGASLRHMRLRANSRNR